MKAFEKMEKREERRKEALQRMTEKKESVVEVAEVVTEHEKDKIVADIKPKLIRPAARRRRNKSGPAARKRTQSATASQPVSEDDSSNNAVVNGMSDSNSLDQVPPSTRVPAPAEVGSTSVGTIGSLSMSGFRFPRMKKVSEIVAGVWDCGGD